MGDVPEIPLMLMDPIPPQNTLGIKATHCRLGTYMLYGENAKKAIFTNNRTNNEAVFGKPNHHPYVKDAFHRYIIHRENKAVNPANEGTKAAFTYSSKIPAGGSWTVRLRLSKQPLNAPFEAFDEIFATRQREADSFYQAIQNTKTSEEENQIQRQAFAGLLWNKQLYYYDVNQWCKGDPIPLANARRRSIATRNGTTS